jgi:hypothetical protein
LCQAALIAWAVFKWLGPQFISKSWFNLDLVWAVSLILVGQETGGFQSSR